MCLLFNREVVSIFRVFVAAVSPFGYEKLLLVASAVHAVFYGRGNGLLVKSDKTQESASSIKTRSVLLFTLGSRGDVEPFVALGRELQDRGHSCIVCTIDKYMPLVTSAGLTFATCGE